MKRNRQRNSVYGPLKRSAPSTYSAYNVPPYRQQNQCFSPVSQNASHNQMHFGHQTPNCYMNNNGNGWPMQPPVQYPMPPFVHQSHYQYPQVGSGPPCSSQASLMPYSNISPFSVPPPPYPPNGQNSFQTGNNTPTKPRPQNDAPKRKWSREDALRALDIEEELCKRNTAAPYLVIRFPDPPLDTAMVKGFSREIEAVHFQKNSAPRFCFVRLKDDADAEKVINEVSKIPFGMGHLSAELRFDPTKPPPSTKPEQVDPYTLYVGNLSLSVSVETIKRHFPGALRYDLAFKSKVKPIRYAFIRFESTSKAIEAFKHGMNLQVDGRSLVLRFRRAKLNYPAENKSSASTNSSNIGNASVTDLTAENDCNAIEKIGRIAERPKTPNGEAVVKNEIREDEICETLDHIKEEHYDSEYSYEDECSNSYCGFSHNDDGQIDIKSEADEYGPCDSNSTDEEYYDGDHAERSMKYSSRSAMPTSSFSSNTRPESCDKRRSYLEAQASNMGPLNENAKFLETSNTISSRASISEKKYIENLYDQLNSSRVLKKEVRSDFDEIEEMLKEVD
ncbi:uncharacterized protein LOC128867726 [Anastrepha ludens]|uniref:uncharacterized protein LOC128867726 n=1 Tax=Anastrepha ludens TaxID=28586 RepID=UPI0023B1557B|nr:uncharacterized protein LOC128867726 [Anastrepha ludens]